MLHYDKNIVSYFALAPKLTAFLLGALTVLGFAPYYLFFIPWLALALIFVLLHSVKSAKQAYWLTFSFGLGLHLIGTYWLYICLHDYGGMAWWFACICVFGLNVYIANFAALAAYFSKRLDNAYWMLTLPILWGLSDWVLSWLFKGFPWLTLGYSQVPFSPLKGYLPVVGVYGVSIITALVAMLLAQLWLKTRPVKESLAVLIGVFTLGGILSFVPWTQPTGATVSVALLQGNINQAIKWSPDYVERITQRYLDMVKSSQAQLIVLPETSLPMLASQMPEYVTQALNQHAQSQSANIIIGMIDREGQSHVNGAVSIGVDPAQRYAKYHLVPFGEYIPLKSVFGWVYRDWLNMPLSDLTRGAEYQTPMRLGNQMVAMNICYEDVFGEEITHQLPQATLLVNISNDAWYGQSFASIQHLQISQTRAIETGRMMLRATNTGATAIIAPSGEVLAHAPHDVQTILTGQAQGYQGTTPYVYWTNWPFIIGSAIFLLWVWLHRRIRTYWFGKTPN